MIQNLAAWALKDKLFVSCSGVNGDDGDEALSNCTKQCTKVASGYAHTNTTSRYLRSLSIFVKTH